MRSYDNDHPYRVKMISLLVNNTEPTRSEIMIFHYIPYATLIRPLVISDANSGLTEGQLQIKYDVSRAAIRWILR